MKIMKKKCMMIITNRLGMMFDLKQVAIQEEENQMVVMIKKV